MAPPKFGDLSKSVNDLFKDDFTSGLVKATFKSKTANGVDFKVEGKQTTSDGSVSALLETKYTHPSGVSVKETWDTKNVVSTEVSAANLLLTSTKLTGKVAFSPNSGLQSYSVSEEYKKDAVYANLEIAKGKYTFDGVYNYQKFNFGAKLSTDSFDKIKTHEIAGSYVESDFTIASSVVNANQVTGSLFHTPNEKTDVGVKFFWERSSRNTGFEVAAKYSLDRSAYIKGKINKDLSVGLAYKQKLRQGVAVTLSAQVNAKQLDGDNHKLGLALSFDN